MADVNSLVTSLSGQKANNKGKKRKVNADKWKNNVRKVLRNSGKPYISSRGRQVDGKLHPNEVSLTMLYINHNGVSVLYLI